MVAPRVRYVSDLAMPYSRDFADSIKKKPGEAIKALRNKVRRARASHDRVAEMRTLTEIGHAYYLTGRLSQAEDTYDEVLKVAVSSGDHTWKALSLLSLGAVNTARGLYGAAQDKNLEALSMFRSSGGTSELQMILNNLGVLHRYRDDYIGALTRFRTALEIDGRPSRERALILKNVARFCRHWGRRQEAIESYERSVEAARDLRDLREEGEALMELAAAHAAMTYEKEKAFDYAERALDTLKRARVDTGPAMKLMGDLHLDAGAPDRAEPYLREAGYGSSLGRYDLIRWNPQSARKHFQDVLQAAREDQNLDELFAAYTGLGRVAEVLEDYRQAEYYYAGAAAVAEDIRDGLITPERRNFYSVSINGFARSEPAKRLIRVALKQGKPEQSIYAGETIRARAFADNLALRVEGGSFGVPRDVLQQESDIANQFASVLTARGILPKAMDRERFSKLTEEIRIQKTRLEAFVKELRRTYPDYAEVKYPKPMKLNEVAFRPNEYVLMLDIVGEEVAVRLLYDGKVVGAFLSKWEQGSPEQDVRAFRRPFEQVRLRDFNIDLARELYRRLMAEPLKAVAKGGFVTIIADAALALLPFEALIHNGNPQWAENDIGPYLEGVIYVGDLYHISYGQSLTAVSLTRKLATRSPPAEGMLVLADPVFEMSDPRARSLSPETTKVAGRAEAYSDRVNAILGGGGDGSLRLSRLQGTWELARNLKNTYGAHCDVYSGLSCTKKVLLDDLAGKLDRYKSIIMATHGFVANDVPGFMEPVMALTMVPPGTDGLLTMSDVAGMKLNADVAALTACETGVGMKLAGEGIMSMGRAFQCAGARSVIMSLWSVAEEPSVRLIEEFFRAYGKDKTRLDAWAEARNRIRQAGFEHPFFWAGFILVGE
ncbi:MAG: CHAT domain-containing tetratricopeptide repeat protein [Desulfomonilaceae bacterium]|nr:CHAT domain-containing tetratricopeptide repeat protein [Desulfomonilaceae bacterium]